MQKELSIVRVDTRHYRAIARENWGLTPEQMKGKHVHHRIAVSDGGTNDPVNLYVCDPWFHKNVGHAEDSYNSLILYAKAGGKKAYAEKKGFHGLSPIERRRVSSKAGKIAGRIAVESGQLARVRTPETILKGAIAGGNSKWSDPDHPEIGIHNAGTLVRKQMALGLPHGKENRVKVG